MNNLKIYRRNHEVLLNEKNKKVIEALNEKINQRSENSPPTVEANCDHIEEINKLRVML